jgi:hypothetical protein
LFHYYNMYAHCDKEHIVRACSLCFHLIKTSFFHGLHMYLRQSGIQRYVDY